MTAGRVAFVGCGPGAADLLTLRAVRALEDADVVIWSPSLLDRQALAAHTRAETEIVEWPPARQRDIEDTFDRARAEDLFVVRCKGGDPSLFGALEPDLSSARRRGLRCEIIPGVSALSAGAAARVCELATPDAPLLLVDAGALARDPQPPSSVVVYNAGRDPLALQRALLARGLPRATSCTVATELTRRDEATISCTLDALAETLADHAAGLLTLVFAGRPQPGAATSAKD